SRLQRLMHSSREALDEARQARGPSAQRLGELLIFSAYEDQLQFQVRSIEAFRDLQHHARAKASKEHECCRQVWPQSQLFSFSHFVFDRRLIKTRMQNHSRRLKNMMIVCMSVAAGRPPPRS